MTHEPRLKPVIQGGSLSARPLGIGCCPVFSSEFGIVESLKVGVVPLPGEVLAAYADKGAGEVIPADAVIVGEDGRVEFRPEVLSVTTVSVGIEPERYGLDDAANIDVIAPLPTGIEQRGMACDRDRYQEAYTWLRPIWKRLRRTKHEQ